MLKTLLVVGFFMTSVTFMISYSEAQTEKNLVSKNAVKVKNEKKDFSFLNGKVGTMANFRLSEDKLLDIVNKFYGTQIKKLIYTDNMIGSLSMLKSGRADFMLTNSVTANYISQRNPDFKVITSEELLLEMVLRISDIQLRDAFNSAINKLKVSGKLEELKRKWISDLPVGQEPSLAKSEKKSYAETIHVGVAGNIPPLDYITADGRPAGYNIALLEEISKIIGKNIEIVIIDSQAKFAALEAKKIDVFFTNAVPNKEDAQKISFDDNVVEQALKKKFIFTEPYYKSSYAFLLKK